MKFIMNKINEKLEINLFEDVTMKTVTSITEQISANPDKEIILNIFTGGGSFYAGIFLYETLKKHKQKSTANIMTLCASAGTIIALGCKEVYMTKTASFMIHPPYAVMEVSAPTIDKIKEDLDNVYGQLIHIYQVKTGMSDEVLRGMMDNQDAWLNYEKALKLGFIDGELNYSNSVKNLILNSIDGLSVSDQLKNKTVKLMDLEKYNELENSFNALTSELDVLKSELEGKENEIKSFLTEKENFETIKNEILTEKEGLASTITALETKVDELTSEKITNFIENAVTSGRITEPQKQNYLKLAENDFETVSELINNISIRTKIVDQLSVTNEANLKDLIKNKENWDEIDFLKKDGETLNRIKVEFPEYYAEIHKKSYPHG